MTNFARQPAPVALATRRTGILPVVYVSAQQVDTPCAIAADLSRLVALWQMAGHEKPGKMRDDRAMAAILAFIADDWLTVDNGHLSTVKTALLNRADFSLSKYGVLCAKTGRRAC